MPEGIITLRIDPRDIKSIAEARQELDRMRKTGEITANEFKHLSDSFDVMVRGMVKSPFAKMAKNMAFAKDAMKDLNKELIRTGSIINTAFNDKVFTNMVRSSKAAIITQEKLNSEIEKQATLISKVNERTSVTAAAVNLRQAKAYTAELKLQEQANAAALRHQKAISQQWSRNVTPFSASQTPVGFSGKLQASIEKDFIRQKVAIADLNKEIFKNTDLIRKNDKAKASLKQGNYASQILKEEAAMKSLNAQRERSTRLTNQVYSAKGAAWLKSYSSNMVIASAETKKFDSQTTKASASTKNLQIAMAGMARSVGVATLAYSALLPLMAGMAAGAAVKKVYELGDAFEYTTTFIDALNESVGGLDATQIQDSILGLEGLRKGPIDLASGMREFAKAGVEAADSIEQIAELSKFATIAELELGDAVKLTVGQAKAFGIEYTEAANIIASAALSSATDIEELGNALSYTTELATVSGTTFDEVATAMAIMANAGIRGSKAGTAIRTSILKMQAPTAGLKKKLDELGISWSAFTDKGRIKDMRTMFTELKRVTDNLPDAQRVGILKDLFGLRALKGGANILRAMGDEWDTLNDKIKDSVEGASFIAEKYEEVANTTRAKWEELGVAIEKSLLQAFDSESVGSVIENLTEAFSSDDFVDSLSAVVDSLNNVALAITNINNVVMSLPGDVVDVGLIAYAVFGKSPLGRTVAAFIEANKLVDQLAASREETLRALGDTEEEIASKTKSESLVGALVSSAFGINRDTPWSNAEGYGERQVPTITSDKVKVSYDELFGNQWLRDTEDELQRAADKAVSQLPYLVNLEAVQTGFEVQDLDKIHGPEMSKGMKLIQKEAEEAAKATKKLSDEEDKRAERIRQLADDFKIGVVFSGDLLDDKAFDMPDKFKDMLDALDKDINTEGLKGMAKYMSDIRKEAVSITDTNKENATPADYDATADKLLKIAKATGEWDRALVAAGREGENLWDGFNAGLLEANDQLITLGEVGFQVFKQLESSISSVLSTAGKNFLYGLDDAKDAIDEAFYQDETELAKNYEEAVKAAEGNTEELIDLAEQYNKDIVDLNEQKNKDIEAADKQLGVDLKEIWENTWKGIADTAIDLVSEKITNEVLNIGISGINELFGTDFATGQGFVGDSAKVHVTNMDGIAETGAVGTAKDTLGLLEKGYDWLFGGDTSTAIGDAGYTLGTKNELDFSGDWLNKDINDIWDTSEIDTSGWDIEGMADTFWSSQAAANAGTEFWSVGGGALSGTDLGSSIDNLDNTFDGFQKTSDELQKWSDDFDWDKEYSLTEQAKGYWNMVKPYVGAASGAYGVYSGVSNFSEDPIGGGLQTAAGANQLYQSALSISPEFATAMKDVTPIIGAAGNVIGFAGGVYGTYKGIESILAGEATAGTYGSAATSAYGAYQAGSALYAGGASGATGAGLGTALSSTGVGAAVGIAVTALASFADSIWGSKGYSSLRDETSRGETFTRGYEATDGVGSQADYWRPIIEASKSVGDFQGGDGVFQDGSIADLEHLQNTLVAHLELLSTHYDDTFADLTLALDASIPSFDTYIDALVGQDVALQESVTAMELAAEAAATGNFESLSDLSYHLQTLGIDAQTAKVAAVAMSDSFDAYDTSLQDLSAARIAEAQGIREVTEGTSDAITANDLLVQSIEGYPKAVSDAELATQAYLSATTAQLNQLGDILGYPVESIEDMADVFEKIGDKSGEVSNQLFKFFQTLGGVAPRDLHYVSDTYRSDENAHGGFVGYAHGGFLEGGSGTKDDLYIGTVNGRAQLAMGGEHIMPVEQSKKYARELELMRADKYANGGFIGYRDDGYSSAIDPYAGPQTEYSGEAIKNWESITSAIDKFNDVLGEANLDEYTDAIRKINVSYAALIKDLKNLGASEADIQKAINAQTIEIDNVREIQYEDEKARIESLASLIEPLRVAHDGINKFQQSLISVEDRYSDLEKQAEELGATESQLAFVRETSKKAAQDIIAVNAEALNDLLKPMENLLAGVSAFDQSLQDVAETAEDQVKAAVDLGASEEQLATIREHGARKVQEVFDSNAEALKNILDPMDNLLNGVLSLDQAITDVNSTTEDQIKAAIDLGASEEQLATIREHGTRQTADLYEQNAEQIADLVQPYDDLNSGMSDMGIWVRNLKDSYVDASIAAEELGANQETLNAISAAQNVEIQNQIADLVQPYDDLVSSMSDMEKWVQNLDEQYSTAIESAKALGASQETLNSISAAQNVEIQNEISKITDGIADIISKDVLTDLEFSTKGVNDKFDDMRDSLRTLGASSEDLLDVEKARNIELQNLTGQDPSEFYRDLAARGAVVSTFGSQSAPGNLNSQNNIEVFVTLDGNDIINDGALNTKIVEVSENNTNNKSRRDYSGQTSYSGVR